MSVRTSPSPRGGSTAAGERECIWVGVRLRPLNAAEVAAREHVAWEVLRGDTLRFVDPVDRAHAAVPTAFCYDRVFPTNASNETVYTHSTAGLVASAMRGLNATVFAYGQTGSGKTYTMRALMRGASQQIFDLIRCIIDVKVSQENASRVSGLS
jgi:centromeric protein E